MKKTIILLIALIVISVGLLSGCTEEEKDHFSAIFEELLEMRKSLDYNSFFNLMSREEE